MLTVPTGTSEIAPAEDTHTKHATLRLSPTRFRLLWIVIVLVSLLNGVLSLAFAAVYYGGLTIRGGYMIESIGLLPPKHIPYVIAAYAFVSVYFFSVAWETIAASIYARRLVLHQPSTLAKSPILIVRIWYQLRHRIASFFAMNLSPESFELLFLVRECVEVSTQTYQAYKCSTLISERWINTFYVAMLAANCWVAPLIHVSARGDRTRQRFLYVCSDVVLDLASTLVIPVCIIASVVVTSFNVNSSGEYAFDAPYNDVTLMYQVKSVQQICVVSWLDFATKMMPFYSMANCIGHLQTLVEPPFSKPVQDPHRIHVLPPTSTSKSIRQSFHAGLVTSQAMLAARLESARRSRVGQNRVVRLLASVHCIHALFAVCGVFVVACHLHAEYVSRSAPALARVGCKAHSQPWLERQYSCTILEINCYRRGISGSAVEIDAALARISPAGLASLIITHCPQLEIPSRVQTLSNMLGFEVTNATLASWPMAAALREPTNPAMQYLCLVRTNMTGVPDGLQALDFPSRLRDLSIVASNLTHLPDDLHLKWKRLLNLFIERTQIRTFPSTLAFMHPGRLSLMGNELSEIPDDGLSSRANRFQVLSIARTWITHWPMSIGQLEDLEMVIMDYTSIGALPTWLLDEGKRRGADGPTITVSAGGSALCLEVRGDVESPLGLRIVCREKQDAEFEAYPLTFNRRIRPL